MSAASSTPEAAYQLVLRPPELHARSIPAPRRGDAAPAADTTRLHERLLRVPLVTDRGAGHYEFGKPDPDGVMQVQLAETQVQVSIPRGWVPARGPQVFALVFMMAEWLGWEVHDLQIGGVLQKDVVLQGLVAMRLAQLDAQGVRVPRPVWNGSPDTPRPPGMGDARGPDDDVGGSGRGPQES